MKLLQRSALVLVGLVLFMLMQSMFSASLAKLARQNGSSTFAKLARQAANRTCHGAPLPPESDGVPCWMKQSSLTYNAPARRALASFESPTRETTLHLTIASGSLAEWVSNWVGHAASVGIDPLIVGASDRSMLDTCEKWNLASVSQRNATLDRAASRYIRHQSDFLSLGAFKVSILIELLTPGFSVLLSDVDVIWLDGSWRSWMQPLGETGSGRTLAGQRSSLQQTAAALRGTALHGTALPEAILLHHADVLVSTDELDAEMDAADLSRGPGDAGWLGFGMRSDLNTGILFFRGGAPGALALAHAWRERITLGIGQRDPAHDQAHFLRLVTGEGLVSVSKQPAAWHAWVYSLQAGDLPPSLESVTAATRDVFRGRVADSSTGSSQFFTVGTLPAAQFAGGHYWFVQRAASRPDATARGVQALHLTFGFGDGVEAPHGKRQRAREAGVWRMDDDDYYGHHPACSEGRDLADCDSEVDGELFLRLRGFAFEESERMRIEAAHPESSPRRHLKLVALQLAALRQLLTLAHALNATLVMPQLACACDRHWGLLRACRAPDAPASMRLPFRCPMDHLLEVSHWIGQQQTVRFREDGFLSNPRLAPSVRRETVRLFARSGSGGGATAAAAGSAEAGFAVGVPHGTRMDRSLLPRVRAANPRVRLVEIGLSDLRGLCPRLATQAETSAFDARARDLLSGRGAAPVAYCPAEENADFPGWSRWDGKAPPLNCSRREPAREVERSGSQAGMQVFDAACDASL